MAFSQADAIVHSHLLLLRRTRLSDIDFVLKTEQHAENRPFITQWTREQHEEILTDADKAHLIIESSEDGRKIGYAIIAGLQNPHQSIELTRLTIAEKGKGYGREALRLIKKWVFEDLRAHRLWLDVKDFNHRARNLYKSEGFVEEGTLRECLKAGDHFETLILMSILSHEYFSAAS